MNIQNLIKLLEKRRSCRSYKDKPVPDDKIGKCLEAVRLAPSACNQQPWRFIIVKDSVLREKICSKGLLPGIPMPWLKNAPVIVVLCADKSLFAHKIAPVLSGVPYHLIDIGIAGEHFVLAAESQNLGTCWIGWFNEKNIKKILSIPRSIQVLSLISLGYPAEQSEASKRLSIEEISFIDRWE